MIFLCDLVKTTGKVYSPSVTPNFKLKAFITLRDNDPISTDGKPKNKPTHAKGIPDARIPITK